ncbi:PB1 domain-containing protein [Citrus sinensis]|nr:uncharacterized protein LOC102620638 [Citrus sinensis]XP_024044964.1 uncharacterized protein LOC18049798 [Citrus x clementina]KAH9720440.1 PB1 domain-containing protein [Citrus sinensis]KDO69494.1 hypothetical protein CISIN_1g029397mg [Citrus sinensis]
MVVRVIESKNRAETLKFLCSYGGKILPRSMDGQLRYVGGLTRVLSVERSISFAELMVKLGEFCGYSVTLRCQLPNGDLETLISIKSDDDLANLIEEYDRAAPSSKIRAILSPPASLKKVSPPASVDLPATKQPVAAVNHRSASRPFSPPSIGYRCQPSSPPYGCPVSGKVCYYPCHLQGTPRSLYYGPHNNYWH